MDKTRRDNGGTWRSRRAGRSASVLLALALIAASLVGFASSSGASGDKYGGHKYGGDKYRVSGTASFSDCNDGAGVGALAFEGDLTGCLTFFPTHFKCKELNGFAHYREWGTEVFEGSWMGHHGVFHTRYKIDATYVAGSCEIFDGGGFPAELQLTGGCRHLVMGQSGAFAGVMGLIRIMDVIAEPGVSGATEFLWRGVLKPS